MSPNRPLLASELYAASQSRQCVGDQECHWCSAPCTRHLIHDDIVLPFQKRTKPALRPASPYLCLACWMWNRRSVTVFWLGGNPTTRDGLRDRQCPLNHAWWIADDGAWAIRPESAATLWKLLLSPPLRFSLAFRNGGKVPSYLQMMHANDHVIIQKDTPLTYTVDNVRHEYTVYELEHAVEHGPDGTEPGVQALLRLLGPCPDSPAAAPLLPPPLTEKRGRGRPTKEGEGGNTSRKMLRASGYV